jgi:hypothetical protein
MPMLGNIPCALAPLPYRGRELLPLAEGQF